MIFFTRDFLPSHNLLQVSVKHESVSLSVDKSCQAVAAKVKSKRADGRHKKAKLEVNLTTNSVKPKMNFVPSLVKKKKKRKKNSQSFST